MKVLATVNQDIEIDVSAQDFINGLIELSSPENKSDLLNILNTVVVILNTIPNDIIDQLPQKNKTPIASVLVAQSQRFLK